MSIYLLGVVLAFIFCIILHFIEWYEGVHSPLGEKIFITLLFSVASWLCVFFCAFAIVTYLFDILQRIEVKGRTK